MKKAQTKKSVKPTPKKDMSVSTDRLQDSVNELSYESRKMRTRVDNLELKVFGSIQDN